MHREAPFRVRLLQGTLDVLILRAPAEQSKWNSFSRAMALILNPVDQYAQ